MQKECGTKDFMGTTDVKIGVMAPAARIEPELSERIQALAAEFYPDSTPQIVFHPQCYLSSGHFAGPDSQRAEAFIEMANDPTYDALWFARGGYGAARILETSLSALNATAKDKIYLGYSDAGSLLGALYRNGFHHVAHGPMPADLNRAGGEEAIRRALEFLILGTPQSLEPSTKSGQKFAAFNITILSHLLGTPYQPDLADHILMLEEVSEHMYRIDRALFHITSNPQIRKVAGIRLGRCSDILENDVDFGQTEVDIIQDWCGRSGIPYLGRADIGHDISNKIVPFGEYGV